MKKKVHTARAKAQKDPKSIHQIAPFKLKTRRKNQLLLFLKPEVFEIESDEKIDAILDLLLEQLTAFDVSIDGAALFPGPVLAANEIMDRHYGAINKRSKSISKTITPDQRKKISQLQPNELDWQILGGHEILTLIPNLDAWRLDEIWWEKGNSTKVESGFYIKPLKMEDTKMIAVNAFHPKQLAHYTLPDRQILVFLVSSDTPWEKLRVEMLGDGFPEKALPSSFRGRLFSSPSKFGLETVSIANNAIHLSAGPTEALFEIDNFLKNSLGHDKILTEAKLASDLKKAGLSKKEIEDILTDSTLHSKLEHKDTQTAVAIIKAQRSAR